MQIKQEGNQVRRRAAQLERKKEDERPVAVNTIEGPKTVPRNLPVRRTNTTADLYRRDSSLTDPYGREKIPDLSSFRERDVVDC